MKTPLSHILADADALSRELANLALKTGPASAFHMGNAGRKRVGHGESFWQYRGFTTEDSVDRVDWRKSARGNQLFVRETELESARTFLFWCDPSTGFDWRGSDNVPTKAMRALSILTAFAGAISKSGDRSGALGGPRKPTFGSKAHIMMAEDLWQAPASSALPQVNQTAANIIIASDFYRPLDELDAWIKRLASKNKHGVLLMVMDPLEVEYPFDGRINFFCPGQTKEKLLGRAENIRQEYLQRFEKRQNDIKLLAESLGWLSVFHITNTAAAPILVQIANKFEIRSTNGTPK